MAIHYTILIIAGDCPFGRQLKRLVILSTDYDSNWEFEEQEQTVFHLKCQCPAFAVKRRKLRPCLSLSGFRLVSFNSVPGQILRVAKCFPKWNPFPFL